MALPITILIFGFVFLMILGANMMVVGLRRFARETHTGVFALSAILLALATSFPELSVAVTSGLGGVSSLSFGNVIGANIANLTLVVGGAAVIAGRVAVVGREVNREVWLAGIAGMFPLLLLFDGTLSRIDGVVLISFWIVYVLHFFKIRFSQLAREFAEEGFWHRFLHKTKVGHIHGKEVFHLLGGIFLLLFSAEVVVRLGSALAHDAGIPLFMVGVFVLAVGTTLPEFIFSFDSLMRGEPTMFLANLLGSIIVNSTLIVGLASLLSPIEVDRVKVLLLGLAFVVNFLLFSFFIKTKRRLDRWEAGVLLGVYVVFVLLISR